MTERITLFVNVILPIPVYKEFTYRVPYDLNDRILIGTRVVVPFGKSKLYTGIVTKISEKAPEDYIAKYVEHVLDDQPIITHKQYQLWKWISGYYLCALGEVMNAALPTNFKLASESKVALHPEYVSNAQNLDEREKDIIDALEVKESLDLKEISEIIGIKTVHPIIKRMYEKRVLLPFEELNNRYRVKTKTFVNLHPDYLDDKTLNDLVTKLEVSKKTEKVLNALLSILKHGQINQGDFQPIEKKELLNSGVSASSLNTLEKNGIIEIVPYAVSRFKAFNASQESFKALSVDQLNSFNQIQDRFANNNVTLLHGVTGSGKTEIYVQLIQEQLDMGKQVLFLLPEIALTTQLIRRLSQYFGDQVGVYHSKFNQNERVEIWNHVLKNDRDRFRIILGARSAVFLPFQDLGLIIVDEEHEPSFKQYDPAPRYNARDVAIILGHQFHSKVLLGSATPSFESFHNAKTGKYGLVELNKRFGNLLLPEIFCADLKKERKQKTLNSHFSSFLLEHISDALKAKEQVILFQNRRGYAPLWSCEICSWTPKCKHCDVSLTYHKHANQLKCHYCGYVSPPIGSCKSCGSNRLKMLGFGTEKIEDELQLIFPDAQIQRLDLDATRSKNAYENIITDFESRKIDILIGTQMVSKGLDFDHVSLVGILDADLLLNRPDFRAFERSFQLMSQVAGRSGRKSKRGKVVLQTYDPDNWVIRKVIDHDFIGFYESEIIERKNFFYPPFFKIIAFTLKSKEENQLNEAAQYFASELRTVFKERVMGPEFPLIKKIQNNFLKVITLKIEKEASDKMIKERIQQLIDAFYSVPSFKSIRIVTDVDPA
jgi:primosomal protein N' (replication factor Y)